MTGAKLRICCSVLQNVIDNNQLNSPELDREKQESSDWSGEQYSSDPAQ
jgi:hypothetical protein